MNSQKSVSQTIRNVAVIAHVDHGKTTLVDKLLKATGSIPAHQQVGERILDSGDLEKERGITLLAKNISLLYKDVKINLIDTPGHADFGGEVERVLQMADGALVLVDAAEGPMPQTRFVLTKAFERGLRPIVVVNKIDRQDARSEAVVDEIGELFLDLAGELGLDEGGGSLDILDFPVIYASARDGYALRNLGDEPAGIEPVLEAILDHVPVPEDAREGSLQLEISSLVYSDFVGRIGIGRVRRGSVAVGD